MSRSVIGAFLFGMGIIGMLDGIIFHQILQWHSVYMPTNRFYQIVSDGFFHLIVTAIIFVSGIFLWQAHPDEKLSTFWGGFFMGAGTFNLVEGLINHHLLNIHHVKPGPSQFFSDIAYDVISLLLLAVGWLMLRQTKVVRSTGLQ